MGAMISVRDRVKEVNAMDVEHIATLAAGTAMVLLGMRRGGILGGLMKMGGTALVLRGQTGYGRLYRAVGLQLPALPTGVGKQNVRVEASVVVRRPRQEIYRIWRNLENLPVFMDHLLSVHEIDDTRSLWVGRAPAGMVIKWDAEIINDIENELIAWQTLEGSGVDHAGSIRFSEVGDKATKIDVVMRYDPPADLLGVWIAKIFHSDPQRQIERDLQHFKAIMELGRQPSRNRKPARAQVL